MPSIDSKKKRVYASNAAMFAVFVIGAIVVINVLSTRVFGRLDLTASKNYTLSKASKDLVKQLPDYLTVKAFISNDLPPQLLASARYVRDLVDEYKNSSNGKLTWEAIDPKAPTDEDEKKKLAEEAQQCKVRQISIQELATQKVSVGAYYLGLCFQYGGQTEAIAQIPHAEGLEYQISSIIKRMTQKKRKVAFTNGHGELDMQQGLQFVSMAVKEEFEATTVNPSQGNIGDDIDALVVAGPKQAFDEKGRREIDRFLMTGKSAIFLVDGMTMASPQGAMPEMAAPRVGQPNNTGLDDLLGAYGFKIGQDFVFDMQAAAPGPVDLGGQKMLESLPMFMAVPYKDDKSFSVMAGIRGAVFPYASSVQLVGPLDGGKAQNGGKLWTLAQSAPSSWKETGFFVFQPEMYRQRGKNPAEGKTSGSFGLGYAFEGKLKSAFAPAAQNAAMSSPDQAAGESKKPVRLIVFGDSDFVSDEYAQISRFLPIYVAGAQMLYNAISWTLEDETLIPIRAKTFTARPLTAEVSDATAITIKWLNMAGVPLAFCAYGLVRWRLRRRARENMKLA